MGKFKPNGFILFANEFKKKQNFMYLTFRELLEAAGPFWNELSENEKEVYKERAKRGNRRFDMKRSYPTVSEVEIKRTKVEDGVYEKRQLIENMVYTASDLGELDDLVFYFINISTYFEDMNEIHPAEIAIAKYSLRKGLIDTCHIKMACRPLDLPSGAAYTAREKAKNTHKYDINDQMDDAYDSYILVLLKIVEFLDGDDEELPLFFTDDKELPLVERAFVRIFEGAAENQIASRLKLYPIIDLFYYLNKVSNDEEKVFKTLNQAADEYEKKKTVFEYTATGCKFHEYHDCFVHCSLSKVVSYAYIISTSCLNPTKYPLIEGKHYPKGYLLTK